MSGTIETTINGLMTRAKKLAEIDEENMVRRDLGAASFEIILRDIVAAKKFSKRIGNCSWEGVPEPVIQTCSNKLDEVNQTTQEISAFNILRASNVDYERNAIIANFRNTWSQAYSIIVPHLCNAENMNEGANSTNQKMAQIVSEANLLKQEIGIALKTAQEESERVKKVAAGVDEAAKRTLVNHEAIHFKKLADQYRNVSGLWLFASAVFGVALYSYVQNFHMPDDKDTILLAEHLVPRLVTVTLLSTGLIFCVRNFSAFMHNMIVNRHRQTALSTFQTFVSSTTDEGTKNAVLVQSTQAIFAPQPSGYLKSETEMPQVNQVTEIVRGITGKDK